tara:strand:- start:1273 stop:1482 length:210 start_codon:yes stop_codon:yes gene_type:complete
MKKPKTLNDLKKHPLVDEIWFEDFDDGEEYCLSLKEPYWFSVEESTWIHCKTVNELINSFFPVINKDYK